MTRRTFTVTLLITLATMLITSLSGSASPTFAITAPGRENLTVGTESSNIPVVASGFDTGSTTFGAASADKNPAWLPPLSRPLVLSRPFEAPATLYTAGHRGIDLPASPGETVVAPASGTISFSGTVVDRPLLTIDTGSETLVSMEPVSSSLPVGSVVVRGQALGETATGGHCGADCLHLGVRVAGEYVSPMLFFGGIPPAILLPLRHG